MKQMTGYQFYTNCLAIFLSTGETMWINFNENSGKAYYRDKIGSLTNIKHTGIFVGTDAHGTEWWIHNHYHFGTAHLVTGAEFKKGMPIYLYKEFCTNSWDTIIEKALQHVQRKERYMPLSYNCQTLVNDACNNQRKSEDGERLFKGALVGLALIGIFSALESNHKK